MPKMGDAMTEGKVVQWYKTAGDAVKKGEPLLEIETDKVNLDLEAEADGILEGIDVDAGEVVDVGVVLATIGDGTGTKDRPSKRKTTTKAAESVEQPRAESPPAETQVEWRAPVVELRRDGFVKSSPLARRKAGALGVDIGAIAGSGPGGRVIAADIDRAAAAGVGRPAPGPSAAAQPSLLTNKRVPLSAMRRTIAKRLAESTGPIPHFYLTVELDVTEMLSLRSQLNEIQSVKTSPNDFVIRAVALSMLQHPGVNSSFDGDAIQYHDEVHVGVAVATEEGLITPVIRNADRKTIPQIAGEVRELADRARNRKLRPDEYLGSTFTISNLGMYGIEGFTAIINPPNSAILAVGAAIEKPVVKNGSIVVRQMMKVTMSCDHRVVDGASGSEYLATLRQYTEQPLRLLV